MFKCLFRLDFYILLIYTLLDVCVSKVFLVPYMKRIMKMEEFAMSDNKQDVSNGAAWGVTHIWEMIVDRFGLPFGHCCVSLIYSIYTSFTLVNMVIFLVKCVPIVFMYQFIKNIYVTSRERIKNKQIELEDIQLQIVNTKLCVRDAEVCERAEVVRRSAARLRHVRARVRQLIAADDALRRALDTAACWAAAPDLPACWAAAPDLPAHTSPDEEREFMLELLKELKYDQVAIPERQTEKLDCGEHAQSETNTPENSVYSSLSDVDVKKDCRVKIVKVTNVYKVAYLKHYIKQKRLRRATKQALLKKKMEGIKKLLEDWQKTLNMVINSKLSMLNMDTNTIDVASQEAMGDYSKPLRESSDSDSEIKNSGTDTLYDEYSLSWTQNPYRHFSYNYENNPETVVSREYYDSQEYDITSTKYQCSNAIHQYECNGNKNSNVLFILPEETSSQVAMEELKSDFGEDYECRDLVSL